MFASRPRHHTGQRIDSGKCLPRAQGRKRQAHLAVYIESVQADADAVEVVPCLHEAGEASSEQLNLSTDGSLFACQLRLQLSDSDKTSLDVARRGTPHVMQLSHLLGNRARISNVSSLRPIGT